MRIPVSWLRDYVNFEASAEELAHKLTFSGTEVTGIEHVGLKAQGVVVAEVRSVERHPNADRLTVCTVFDGASEHRVVCGAPNVRAGLKSAFAPEGAVLADGTRLKKAKLRGVESRGMLCAEDELGLSSTHAGILELPAEAAPGTPLSSVLGEPDAVLEVEITPNRPDCLSLIGMAREVAALFGAKLRLPEVSIRESDPPADRETSVVVEDPTGCPRYTARVIRAVKVGPSPSWMQRRLQLAGIRPINNLVDITNYVLLETGHPLHAFDQSLLKEGRVVVRPGRRGETITTLDERSHELDESVLVIADAERPVAVAGIMGGIGSEIRDDTSTVLLESAYFHPPLIRATSKKLGLRSESSYRFERGTDIGNVEWASRRAAALIQDLAGGRVAGGVIDVYPSPATPRTLRCRWNRCRSLVGVEASNREIVRCLEALELAVENTTDDEFTICIPTFRADLEREVDVIEEFARIHGLERIPPVPVAASIVMDADDREFLARVDLRRKLAALGLREVMHYSLVSDEMLDRFEPDGPRVHVPNPISRDQSVLRTSLLPQMAETLAHNHARQSPRMSAFELGRVFRRGASAGVEEEIRLCAGMFGPAGRTGIDQRAPVGAAEMFSWIKGAWETLAEAQGVTGCELEAAQAAGFRPGYTVRIRRGGEAIGTLGLLDPALGSRWRFAQPVGLLEVKAAPLQEKFGVNPAVQPPAVFPAVVRDVAILADASVKHEDVLAVIRQARPPELESVELFDLFEGAEVGAGRKSMAYSLTYRSRERTLTDADANLYHERVKEVLQQRLPVEIRDG